MAKRRMFSQQIVDTDAFLDMPLSTQTLYFHLAMRADDDGFIGNSRKIMRMIGAADDDLKILITKRFVLTFKSGVIVIKHWRMHNYLQNDRYQPTSYQDEFKQLSVKENKSYTELKNEDVSKMDTKCIQNGNTGKVRLGKVSTSESNDSQDDIEIIPDESVTPTRQLNKPKRKVTKEIETIFKLFTAKPPANWKVNRTQRQAAENLYNEKGVEKVKKTLEFHRQHKDEPFCPVIDTPYDLDSKWAKLYRFSKKL